MLSLTRTIDTFYSHHPSIAWPLQVVVLIVAVTFVISFASGWRSLAARYRTARPMPPGSFLVSGAFRYIAGYNNVIRAGSDAQGLYLRFWPRLAHPPLFIPWSDVQLRKPWGLIFKSQTMLLGSNPTVPFTIPERQVKRLCAAWMPAGVLSDAAGSRSRNSVGP